MLILLPKVLTRDEPSLWPGLSPPVRAAVRAEMLACIKEEQMRSITKKVCDTGETGAQRSEEAWVLIWLKTGILQAGGRSTAHGRAGAAIDA